LLERLRSPESSIRDAYRHARKHPRVTLGAAAGTAAAVIGVTAGMSAAASPAQHTAGAPFPAAQAAPIVAGNKPAPPAITPPAPSPTVTDHSVAHSSGAVQPQHARAAAPTQHPPGAHAPAAKAAGQATRVHGRGQGQATPGRQAPAAHRAAPAARPPARDSGKSAASRRPDQSRHQASGQHHGRRTWRAAQGRHAAWHGHRAAKKAWPYLIYDSVTPTAIPSHHVVATYATGPYAASPSDVAGRKAVLWIDTHGTDPQAAALDVEPGDATPSMAASWAWQRLHAHPREHAIIYTMRSEWAAAQASIGTLPHWMQNHVRWWIADPTGYPHVVPGSNATQWYWGTHYDITTATPGF